MSTILKRIGGRIEAHQRNFTMFCRRHEDYLLAAYGGSALALAAVLGFHFAAMGGA